MGALARSWPPPTACLLLLAACLHSHSHSPSAYPSIFATKLRIFPLSLPLNAAPLVNTFAFLWSIPAFACMTVRVPTVPLLLYLYDFIAIGASVAWQEGRVDVMRVKCFIVLGNFRRACSVTAAGRRPDASSKHLCAGKDLV